MSSLITSNEEIQSILESCSYEEYARLVPTLQEGMRRLQAQWVESTATHDNPYSRHLTAVVRMPNTPPTSNIRIYTQKEIVFDDGEYEVIASYCDDTYDGRGNYCWEGDMEVVILGRKKGDGTLYLINGSYHYYYLSCQDPDIFSVEGVPSDEPESEPRPGLVFDFITPFAEIVGQLVNRHPWYYTMNDMPQVYCVRRFKEALATVAEAAQTTKETQEA